MMYTITLNPALDHFRTVEELRVDDANRVQSECLYAGGKGIDVSRAIRELGDDSMALGLIGGHSGQIMVDLLEKEGVTCCFTPISQETRRNLVIGTLARGTQTMLNSRGPLVTKPEWAEFFVHLRLLDLRGLYVVLRKFAARRPD
jgi:6-phosphofructokinase 2